MVRLQVPLPDRYTLASPDDLDDWIGEARSVLGERLLILGHHYQRDEIIKWADATGDSFKLARLASETEKAAYIVFCGVHFMAESADVLTSDEQRVILPDLNAGCSMADMADLDQVEIAWQQIAGVVDIESVVPITYMNSSAALKAFVGHHGGAVCTSSNAKAILEWTFGRASKALFFPDQHLGRNTGHEMGYAPGDMRVWDPHLDTGGLEERELKEASLLLWKGHCSVHQRFQPEHIFRARSEHPGVKVVVHPECSREVVELADAVGSTERIIEYVRLADPGSTIAIGTEVHLVQRLARQHPYVTVFSLDPLVCPCSTMFRIDPPHLAWVLENLVRGEVVNQISVDADVAKWARVALERMLDIT